MALDKVIGLDQLNKNLEKLAKLGNPDAVEKVFLKGAQIIADAAEGKARKGPTGKLKRAYKAKLLKRKDHKIPAPAIAAIDRKIAPHAHLAEFGTEEVRIGKKGAESHIGRSFGIMPANPTLRPAADEKAKEVFKLIGEGMRGVLKGVFK